MSKTQVTSTEEATYQAQYATSRHHTQVLPELVRAIQLFPTWPSDIGHAALIIGEELGEVTKDVLQYLYEPNKGKTLETIRVECIQSICMLHRFLNSLDAGAYAGQANPSHSVVQTARDNCQRELDALPPRNPYE